MMFIMFYLFILINYVYSNPIDGTELILSSLVHRHGDRAPLEYAVTFTRDPARLKKLIEPSGFGQLTDAGLERGYQIGKFIRRRYNDQLSQKYNYSEIYIRSTDSSRAKMTVLAAMAAVYEPVGRSWHLGLNWRPTPYTTVPVLLDHNLSSLTCSYFVEYFYKKMESYVPELAEFDDVFNKLAAIGYDTRKYPANIISLYDTFVTQEGLGMDLEPELNEMLPRVEAAAAKAWHIVYGNENYFQVLVGVYLKEFFKAAESAIAGIPTQKIRILSAHDTNVFTIMAASHVVPEPGVINYGAAFALELRRVKSTGKYVILPVYVSSPELEEQYLEVKDCGLPCDYETFKNITSKYLLNEEDWRPKCTTKLNRMRELSLIY